MQREKKEKIGINIFYFSGIEIDERLSNILWGIEEEDIPFILKSYDEADAKILGYNGAKESKLQVGIGIGREEITLYHEKLKLEKPLFKYDIHSNNDILRALGINGARLIKGNPFIIPEETGGEK
ncbi:glycerol dehydratase reactivase beta/small subunit family protein [Fusobacterium sp.]|uniref:glycerol dehydratase reactivase beta/small subunit family protein n=1 Tax=Fusobacterium sp. TaxID=68766 RepID=UPI0025C281FE|nr:glycerol dehydratase reactivase beta/small subunit family protein [Fusobacterium sp.]